MSSAGVVLTVGLREGLAGRAASVSDASSRDWREERLRAGTRARGPERGRVRPQGGTTAPILPCARPAESREFSVRLLGDHPGGLRCCCSG